jgi:hypothetical protein
MSNRFFIHQGTEYKYSGNEGLAHSHFHEVRNHLLGIKRTNVNNLPIVYGTKRFDDGTVAQYQLIHGREIVNVSAPIPPVISGEEHVRRTIIEEIEQIVPVIRSIDNQYWCACLSGTFNGPYYIFKNIYDLPPESFDDEIETDIDRQLISIGTEQIEDSIDDPQLYFIAQTGIRDTATNDLYDVHQDIRADTNYQVMFDPSYETNNLTAQWLNYAHSIIGFWTYCPPWDNSLPYIATFAVSFSANSMFNSYYLYKGNPLIIPEIVRGAGDTRNGLVGTNVATNHNDGPVGALEVSPNILHSFYGESSRSYDIAQIVIKGISIESVNSFSCSYCQEEISETNSWTNPLPDCGFLMVKEIPWDSIVNVIRNYWLQVDDNAFIFYSPPDFIDSPTAFTSLRDHTGPGEENTDQYECLSDSNMIKYYGPDSLGNSTGIMCGRVNKWQYGSDIYKINESCEKFIYSYIGPNNRINGVQHITSTEFIPNITTDYKHIIENVKIDDVDIEFKGEIFLGIIKYEVETVIEDR